MLALIKMWLKAPIEETDSRGNKRLTGGKGSRCGTPQGGVISPLLANIYMNRFLKYWHQNGLGRRFKAHVVVYADDLVILSRGHATEAHTVLGEVMTRIGLTLDATKTKLRAARDLARRRSRHHLRPVLGSADGDALSGCRSFGQKSATAQGQGSCPHRTRHDAAMAGGRPANEPPVTGLAGILRVWHAEFSLQRGQLDCRQPCPPRPQTSAQGPSADHGSSQPGMSSMTAKSSG